jgi:hypothetical protein
MFLNQTQFHMTHYCIGFILQEKTNNDCKAFSQKLESAFPHFVNKLKEREPILKIKPKFSANEEDESKIRDLVVTFSKNLKPFKVKIFKPEVFSDLGSKGLHKEKVAIPVKDSYLEKGSRRQVDELTNLKIYLCLELGELLGKTINRGEPAFVPRITLGTHSSQNIGSVAECLECFLGANESEEILLDKLALFKKDAEISEWVPTLICSLEK